MKKFAIVLAAIMSTTATAQEPNIDLVTDIHDSTNHEIRYKTDRKAGKSYYDSWDIPTEGYGDCEDISLLKKIRLIEAGLAEDDVKLLIVARSIDEGKSNKKVIFLHVVNYIPSLNVILDNGNVNGTGRTVKRKKVPVVTYEDWMKTNKATLLCEVVDESLGDDISLDKRCGQPIAALLK